MKRLVLFLALMIMLAYPAAAWNCYDKDESNLHKADINWLYGTAVSNNDLKFEVDLYKDSDDYGAANPTIALTFFDTKPGGRNIPGLGVYGADKMVVIVWWQGILGWHGVGFVFKWDENNNKWKYESCLLKKCLGLNKCNNLVVNGDDNFYYYISGVSENNLEGNVVQFTAYDFRLPNGASEIIDFIEGWIQAGHPDMNCEINYDRNNDQISVTLSYDLSSGITKSLTVLTTKADRAPDPVQPIPEFSPLALIGAVAGVIALVYVNRKK
ncbi:hypothetical protein DRP07_09040 [Archaeoglobales archaeon]|nr:MAG: hypothetical protein DRP07_09040 [Archaeoglobales archaeon]